MSWAKCVSDSYYIQYDRNYIDKIKHGSLFTKYYRYFEILIEHLFQDFNNLK